MDRALLIAAAAFALLASSGTPPAGASRVVAAASPARTGTATARVSLGECDRADRVLEPVSLPAGAIGALEAADVVRILGARGTPAIVRPVLATAGTRNGTPPTADALLLDAHRIPISARPAWIVVYRDQHIRPPAGPFVRGGPAPLPHHITVIAGLVDAMTGTFLTGWGCAGVNITSGPDRPWWTPLTDR